MEGRDPNRGGPMRSATPITLYDTTLRDGTQGENITLSLADKLRVARMLDEFGFPFIEDKFEILHGFAGAASEGPEVALRHDPPHVVFRERP